VRFIFIFLVAAAVVASVISYQDDLLLWDHFLGIQLRNASLIFVDDLGRLLNLRLRLVLIEIHGTTIVASLLLLSEGVSHLQELI
jgi:hypothetical protein